MCPKTIPNGAMRNAKTRASTASVFVGRLPYGSGCPYGAGCPILIALVPVPTLIAHEVNLGMDFVEECR